MGHPVPALEGVKQTCQGIRKIKVSHREPLYSSDAIGATCDWYRDQFYFGVKPMRFSKKSELKRGHYIRRNAGELIEYCLFAFLGDKGLESGDDFVAPGHDTVHFILRQIAFGIRRQFITLEGF